MKFIITYDSRSGSTLVSKIITEKFNAVVLPESNFIYFIQTHINNKKKIFSKLVNEKKFKSFRIKNEELNDIILKNFPNKKKIIEKIINIAAKRIYRQNTLLIGTKKNQIELLEDTCNIFKKLKVVHLVRDPRNIHLSKKKVFLKRGEMSKSIIFNCYMWLKTTILLEKHYKYNKKNTIIYRYEDITTNITNFQKGIKKFLGLKSSKFKKYFLPIDSKGIHPNLHKKKFKVDTFKFKKELNYFEKQLFLILCFNYLFKYKYEMKINFFYMFTSKFVSFLIKIYIMIKN